jgi:hypothetical protein
MAGRTVTAATRSSRPQTAATSSRDAPSPSAQGSTMSISSRPTPLAIPSGPGPMAGQASTKATRSGRPQMAATSLPATRAPSAQGRCLSHQDRRLRRYPLDQDLWRHEVRSGLVGPADLRWRLHRCRQRGCCLRHQDQRLRRYALDQDLWPGGRLLRSLGPTDRRWRLHRCRLLQHGRPRRLRCLRRQDQRFR